MNKTGSICSINGPIVKTSGDVGFTMHEMVYVGSQKLIGEVIGLTDEFTIIEVYEETGGMKIGELAKGTGAPVSLSLIHI